MTAHLPAHILRLAFRTGVLGCLLVLHHLTPATAQNTLISPPGDQTTVTLACNHFPPAKIADDTARPGYDVEVLRSAFATRNLTLITPFYPWKRAYFLAEAGLVDGLCSCSYLKERETDFLFSDPLGQEEIALFTTRSEILDTITTLEDARNMTIGVVSGYSTEVTARNAKLDVITAHDEETLLNLMLSRRLDAVLSFKPPVEYAMHELQKRRPETVDIKSKVISTSPYYSCITRHTQNADELLEQLNIGLEIIQENGTYDKILGKYGISSGAKPNGPTFNR